MCNGDAPSHLPEAIAGHPMYQAVFQNVVFDVEQKHGTYRTADKVNGYDYSWRIEGERLLLAGANTSP